MKRKKQNGMRSTPTPPIEEVAEELGAEEEEDGERVVLQETAKKDGAANGEAAQSNRVRQTIVDRKRQGERRVHWGEQNVCLFYDDLVAIWPSQSLVFHVTRLTGTPASWYLNGWPRNGKELYEAVKAQCHGFREETEYSVAIRDAQSKYDRGKGRLTIPSTLDEPGRLLPAMQLQPQGVAVPVYPQGYGPAPAPAFPTTGDPYVLALQRQVLELQGKIDTLTRAPAQPQAPPAIAAPTPQPIPQQAPTPGSVYFVPGIGYVQPLVQAPQQPQQAATPAPAPTPAPDPASAFRGAIELAKASVGAARDMASLVQPVQTAAAAATAAQPSEPPPTQLIDLGDMKIMQNTADGSMRPVETILANSDKIFGWVERQQNKWEAHQKTLAQMNQGGPSAQMAQAPQYPQQQQPQAQPQQQQPPQQSAVFPAPTFPR